MQLERARSVASSLDLRGARVEEALEALDRYLDDAGLAGLDQVVVIHGLGHGRAARRGPDAGGEPSARDVDPARRARRGRRRGDDRQAVGGAGRPVGRRRGDRVRASGLRRLASRRRHRTDPARAASTGRTARTGCSHGRRLARRRRQRAERRSARRSRPTTGRTGRSRRRRSTRSACPSARRRRRRRGPPARPSSLSAFCQAGRSASTWLKSRRADRLHRPDAAVLPEQAARRVDVDRPAEVVASGSARCPR